MNESEYQHWIGLEWINSADKNKNGNFYARSMIQQYYQNDRRLFFIPLAHGTQIFQ